MFGAVKKSYRFSLDTTRAILTAFWDWVDERIIVRRIAFFMVMWLVFETLEWTLNFASNSPRPGMEVAAIIAAVWAPITALQAAMFALYSNYRREAPVYQAPAPVTPPVVTPKPEVK